MDDWKHGVDKRLYYSNYGKNDVVEILEDLEALLIKGGKVKIQKGRQLKVRMSGGVVYSRVEGGGKYDEYAILPFDFKKLKFVK